MIKFKLHGFHIIDRINEYLQGHIFGDERGIFEMLVIGKMYPEFGHETIELQAIFYDTKRIEYQAFNKRWHSVVDRRQPLNSLFEIFLDDLYLNMVFSIETHGKIKDPHGIPICTFRDIQVHLYEHGRLPNPTDDHDDVRNYQSAFEEHKGRHTLSQLQLKSHFK